MTGKKGEPVKAHVNNTVVDLVRFTSSATLLRAALTIADADVDVLVAGSVHLPEDLWWELYSRPKVPVALATALCDRPGLSDDQLGFVFGRERRVAPREAALRHNGVPLAWSDQVASAGWLTRSAAAAWLMSGRVAAELVVPLARRSGKPELAARVLHDPVLGDDLAVELLFEGWLSPPSWAPPLPVLELLDRRLTLPGLLVDRFVSGGVTAHRRWLLVAALEARGFTPDRLDEVIGLLDGLAREGGFSPVSWHLSTVNDAVRALFGHPNTPVERLDELAGLVVPAAEPSPGATLHRMRTLRLRCAEAVTGPWTGPLPSGQAQTLRVLALAGLVYGVNGHPRAAYAGGLHPAATHHPKWELPPQQSWDAVVPDASAPAVSPVLWQKWPNSLSASGAKFLAVELDGADLGVWSTVFALLAHWQGTAGDLASAARAVAV